MPKPSPAQQKILDMLSTDSSRYILVFFTGLRYLKYFYVVTRKNGKVEYLHKFRESTFIVLVDRKWIRLASHLGPFETKWLSVTTYSN